MRRTTLLAAITAFTVGACGPRGLPAAKVQPPDTAVDPDGPNRAAVAAQIAPYIDGQIASAIVVGLVDGTKHEIYGFAVDPKRVPNGHSLFEIGSATKVYTGILLADAVQRKEVELDLPVADLLPAGVTVPTKNQLPITLKLLALHASGLPRLPPSLAASADPANPYAKYTEEELYSDLLATKLEHSPGEVIVYSNYGMGLLGFALGRKHGSGFSVALQERVLDPLKLRETFVAALPPAALAKFVPGTNPDLKPVPRWTFLDTLAGAGSIVSSAQDQLRFLDAQLAAAANVKGDLYPQLRFAQESQLEHAGQNESLGWQIDGEGRYWHNGGTGGHRFVMGFDIKTKRGVVVLAATSTSLVEFLVPVMYSVLDGTPKPPITLPTAAQLATYTGTFDVDGTPMKIVYEGARLYAVLVGSQGNVRLAPIGPAGFWMEELQTAVSFQVEGGKAVRAVLRLGDSQLVAPRTDD